MNFENLNFAGYWQYFVALLTTLGIKILGALALWLIGGWLIRLAVKLTERGMKSQRVDRTVIGYIGSTMTVTLKILLVVGILGFLGFETTTFAALLAAVGLAIGAAWSGLLGNFAAGAFLVIFRPFKTGDIISAAGVTGKVEEIGLFTTTINTSDNVMTLVANNKLFNDNIQNFSANPYRKVKCSAQLDHGADHNLAFHLLKERVSQIAHVLPHPEPGVEIANFTAMGPVLEVSASCEPQYFGNVTAEVNRAICETLGDGGFQVPKQHLVIKQ